MDIEQRARRHTLWLCVFPLALVACLDLIAYFVVTVWAYPPEQVQKLLRLSLIGAVAGVPYALLWARSYRQHRAEWVRFSRMSIAERVGTFTTLRLAWPAMLVFLGVIIAGGVSCMISSRQGVDQCGLDGLLLIGNMIWAGPLMYKDALQIKREALAGEAAGGEESAVW